MKLLSDELENIKYLFSSHKSQIFTNSAVWFLILVKVVLRLAAGCLYDSGFLLILKKMSWVASTVHLTEEGSRERYRCLLICLLIHIKIE